MRWKNNGHELENDAQNFLHKTILEEDITQANTCFEVCKLSINRCGAQTLALTIEDALQNDKEGKKTLDIARNVVKKLKPLILC